MKQQPQPTVQSSLEDSFSLTQRKGKEVKEHPWLLTCVLLQNTGFNCYFVLAATSRGSALRNSSVLVRGTAVAPLSPSLRHRSGVRGNPEGLGSVSAIIQAVWKRPQIEGFFQQQQFRSLASKRGF